MKIFLNAGHGGKDPGATSKNGTEEKAVNAAIIKILAELLRREGLIVQEYQEENSINEVIEQENKSKADLFISIHCNGHYSPNAYGTETFYYPGSSEGKKAAANIQAELIKETELEDRGVKPQNYFVLRKTKATAILVECAFITNPIEEMLLKNRPELFAEAIHRGIVLYLKNKL